jgi:hypothetical protein
MIRVTKHERAIAILHSVASQKASPMGQVQEPAAVLGATYFVLVGNMLLTLLLLVDWCLPDPSKHLLDDGVRLPLAAALLFAWQIHSIAQIKNLIVP